MEVRDPKALKWQRVSRGLSQRDLAQLVKCSQTTIYLLETGGMRTLSPGLASQIARRLGVGVFDFFQEGHRRE